MKSETVHIRHRLSEGKWKMAERHNHQVADEANKAGFVDLPVVHQSLVDQDADPFATGVTGSGCYRKPIYQDGVRVG